MSQIRLSIYNNEAKTGILSSFVVDDYEQIKLIWLKKSIVIQ